MRADVPLRDVIRGGYTVIGPQELHNEDMAVLVFYSTWTPTEYVDMQCGLGALLL